MKILTSLKNKTVKKVVAVTTAMSLALSSAVCAFAADGGSTSSINMADTLKSSMDSMVNDFIGYIAVVLPIGLTVFGAVWGIKKAKTFFGSMAKG
jgi:hypothetical protein